MNLIGFTSSTRRRPASAPRARAAPSRTRPAGQPPAIGEQVDDPEADVVAREPVPLARIAQAADDLHARPMVAQSARNARARLDVAVIGGGIIGCSAAAILAERGASVHALRGNGHRRGRLRPQPGAIQHPFDASLAPLHAASLTAYRKLPGSRCRPSRRASSCWLTIPMPSPAMPMPCAPSRPSSDPELLTRPRCTPWKPSLAPEVAAVLVATGYPVPPHGAVASDAALAWERGTSAASAMRRRRGSTANCVGASVSRAARPSRSMRCPAPARGPRRCCRAGAPLRSRSDARGASRSSWSCPTRRATSSRRRRSAARRSADRSAGAFRRRPRGVQPGHADGRSALGSTFFVEKPDPGSGRSSCSPAGRASSRTWRAHG